MCHSFQWRYRRLIGNKNWNCNANNNTEKRAQHLQLFYRIHCTFFHMRFVVAISFHRFLFLVFIFLFHVHTEHGIEMVIVGENFSAINRANAPSEYISTSNGMKQSDIAQFAQTELLCVMKDRWCEHWTYFADGYQQCGIGNRQTHTQTHTHRVAFVRLHCEFMHKWLHTMAILQWTHLSGKSDG